MSNFTTIPKVSYNIEPGDGTGHSLLDCQARNKKGVCGHYGCGNKIHISNPKFIYQVCKVCDDLMRENMIWTRFLKAKI